LVSPEKYLTFGGNLLERLERGDIPVVSLTARSMKGDRGNLLAYGFNAYISKPVDHDTFEKSVREYLNETIQ
jgi:CheY-like chemotaxis protein